MRMILSTTLTLCFLLCPSWAATSTDYPHQSFESFTEGNGEGQYWVYEPNSPKPASAPVVIFNHGWGVMEPALYGAWIEHLVKRGNIVIYPRFQKHFRIESSVTANAIQAVRKALDRLKSGAHVQPDMQRIAVVGHSLGGVISANMAASPDQIRVAALMCVQPGKTWEKRAKTTFKDLSKIPSTTLIISIAGDRDTVVKDLDAKQVIRDSTAVPATRKNYLVFRDADHGFPTALSSTGLIPYAKSGLGPRRETRRGKKKAEESVNAQDEALWSLFDALCDAAFRDGDVSRALGNTSDQPSGQRWDVVTP